MYMYQVRPSSLAILSIESHRLDDVGLLIDAKLILKPLLTIKHAILEIAYMSLILFKF